ncbi:PLP-dependent aminotransferase family protein [Streptacidiphilus jiangxiensis]|uniref:GntR family transcriptional regulator / MocR family aminotransferase n=1 Tax=Streptacidiphilus jiangxiensis TaxID=235985 RepID=A0A1H7YY98_STRJI|nr:PLP-dependent aminotransferase family protein [Streptacidiphilus jiangxiensis]SEM50861.1 GntR family transcriptional regulator / MocR family aminotransferase [Streptacidiphilus jiangxiensis]
MGRSTVAPNKGSKVSAGTSGAVVGSDFLQLAIDEAPPGGRTTWLADRLRAAIADGRLPVGTRLPASRVLAQELRVTRGVVIEAYRRLAESGQIAGRGRLGTVVVAAPVRPSARPPARPLDRPATGAPVQPPAQPAVRPDARLPDGEAECGAALFGSAEREGVVDTLRTLPCRIDFSPGVPDLAAFPRTAWLRAERAVLAGLTPADFGYGDPRGAPALRRAVVGWLARNRGILADPDEVVVVAGVAQALALLGPVLLAEGIGPVAVEDPGSLGARQQLEYVGLTLVPVPVDAGGLDVRALRACGARAVLLTPAHQFPTGAVLDGERRRELLAWVADGGLVIEDDYDAEHRYDRPPVPALRSLLPEGVCYAGSVSKLLAPALRIGWLLVPPERREAIVAAKRHADLGNGVLTQLVLARLMDSGELERHLRHVRLRHRKRRDVMLRALAAHLPAARVHGAAAGLHLTVTFDGAFGDLDDTALASAALARGVKVHPLSWHRIQPGPPGLVLGYAADPAHEIDEGVSLLAAALGDLRRDG